MLNRIILMGRLTRDPELRHTQTGTPVASFSLPVVLSLKSRSTAREKEAGGYAAPSGGFGAPAGGYAPPPAAPSGGYSAPMGGGDQFAELSDDDGELPF